MSEEEKKLPAEETQTPPAMPFPMMNNQNTNKASEKIEMQRATAEVYALHQRAMQQGRPDEMQRANVLLEMCKNVEFASDLLYRVPRGDEKVEGIGADGANEIARIWGFIDSGRVTHGSNGGDEVQMEAFAVDLVGPRRVSSRFTIKTTKTYENKDPKTGKVSYNTVEPKNLKDIMKAEAAKEERNCILDIVPSWLQHAMKKEAKRTLMATVTDIPKAFELNVKKFAAVGVTDVMLWQYIDKKPGAKADYYAKVTAADIVDLRLLSQSAKEDKKVLDYYFPNRNKNAVSPDEQVATEAPKSSTAGTKEAAKSKPTPANSTKKETSSDSSPSSHPAQPESSPVKDSEVREKLNSTELPKSSPAPETSEETQDSTSASDAATSEEVSAPAEDDQEEVATEPPKRKVDLWGGN